MLTLEFIANLSEIISLHILQYIVKLANCVSLSDCAVIPLFIVNLFCLFWCFGGHIWVCIQIIFICWCNPPSKTLYIVYTLHTYIIITPYSLLQLQLCPFLQKICIFRKRTPTFPGSTLQSCMAKFVKSGTCLIVQCSYASIGLSNCLNILDCLNIFCILLFAHSTAYKFNTELCLRKAETLQKAAFEIYQAIHFITLCAQLFTAFQRHNSLTFLVICCYHQRPSQIDSAHYVFAPLTLQQTMGCRQMCFVSKIMQDALL